MEPLRRDHNSNEQEIPVVGFQIRVIKSFELFSKFDTALLCAG